MVVGYIWFLPAVMGTTYMKSRGFSKMEDMRPSNPGLTYGLMFLITLAFTFWLNLNVNGPGQEDVKYATFQHGIGHAIALTIFIMLPVFGTITLFEKRDWKWLLVHVGHWFLRMAVAMGILSLMR